MTQNGLEETVKIRDLVEISRIRTVIQLQDLEDSNLRRMIMESFVLTEEVEENLRAVLVGLDKGQGRGVFLKGHFGSGKSHFLGMLKLLLTLPRAWEPVLSQAPALSSFRESLGERRFLVADVSLVHHRGSEFLEDILLRRILEALGREAGIAVTGEEGRRETFEEIRQALAAPGFSGLVLIVDELSEFLKSKPDARSYNEDIRFLQYLGELAPAFPLWVVASLQEWIEETGEIHQDTFNKIKDRYPVRLNLGRAHIEEIVSERLIRKRPGAEEIIHGIYERLKSYFPTFPVTEERFSRLYPVHPGTCTLLDRLKPLFSEHRGVVDFIHFRLTGDPERRIPSSLDLPALSLLGPEAIFDHFLDRILERPETQAYVERVYRYYEAEIPEMLEDEDQRRIALSLIKLLILFAISPVKYPYTVRHLAEMVLFPVTSLDAEINYRFVRDILETLEKEGSYIRVEEKGDPLDSRYFLDLRADLAGIMRSKLRHLASEIFPEDRRLFSTLGGLVDSPYLPLAGWLERGKEEVTVQWQHTSRKGVLYLRQLNEVGVEELEGLGRRWQTGEEDFFILVGTTVDREAQYRHVQDVLLPSVRSRYPGLFLFWIPAAPAPEAARVREVLAAHLLLEKIGREPSGSREAQGSFLKDFIEREKKSVTELFVQCYFDGTLLWEETPTELSRFGRLTPEKFLAEFARPLLERRFPRHNRIRPYMDAFITGFLKEMLRDFLAQGVLVVDDRSKTGLRNVLDGVLKPMGLVRNKGNRYELQIHPRRNELARVFFETMADRKTVPLEEMYWSLRKGEYGLLMPQFEILVLALLFTGHLVAYKAIQRKSPDELARTGLKGVTSLGRGEILDEDIRNALQEQPLLPDKYRNIPLTLASQQDLWSEVRALKPKAMEQLLTLKSRIVWAASFQAFKTFPWKELQADIETLLAQWQEVKVSLPSKEGLERFIRAGRADPLLAEKAERVKAAEGFFETAERLLFVYQYLTDPKLRIPSGEKYEELCEARNALLALFRENPGTISGEIAAAIMERFSFFQEAYTRAYDEAHRRRRGREGFASYENLRKSRPYRLLKTLDRLEMISVPHHFRSAEQAISSVLVGRCEQPVRDQLQSRPVCSCGFTLDESIRRPPIADLERDLALGIRETMDALGSSVIREKIVPYIEGLDLVGKKKEAAALRRFLSLRGDDENLLDLLEKELTPAVIDGVNEAFRGRVVVVRRDLDELYNSLVHRKYTLKQVREIVNGWLKQSELEEDTFIHFMGKGGLTTNESEIKDPISLYLEKSPGPLEDLYREMGPRATAMAVSVSLWASQYDVPVARVLEVLPFPGRGSKEDDREWFACLRDIGVQLRRDAPELFEKLVSGVEEDVEFVRSLWGLIPGADALEVFQQESVYPVVLREAFERLLAEGLEPPAPSDPGASIPCPGFLARKEEMARALSLHRRFMDAISTLEEKAPPSGTDSWSRWETVYTRHLAFLPSTAARLRHLLARVGTPPPPFLADEERRAQKEILRWHEAFSGFLTQSGWEEGTLEGPSFIRDIPTMLKAKRNVPDHREVRYVLLDGMRWDLWVSLKEAIFEKFPQHFRVVREGALWAFSPTNTETQMERLRDAFRSAFPQEDLDTRLLKLDGIDEMIHAEKGPWTRLASNAQRYLENELLFRLRRLPAATLLIVFADHGFVENPGFDPSMKYEAPRYVHGGPSPFEVIVPWAWVMRI
ncbi:MAG: hypothetical protein JRJ35_10515 [Deltaproteobacteria bacterium]|nr:hypothetical protein [Deltaproteobacteria bacterium]